MTDRIIQELETIEDEHGVRVLFACESGSRAWGFESPDSDWDVRFLYVHPMDWYLSVESRRDVIERMLPDDLDLAGWDLRKALGLLRKSNPSLLEWLNSPIVYRSDAAFLAAIKCLARECFSSDRLFQHYLSMAKSNSRTYLQSEEVSRKKYLYALRPILACHFIEATQSPPPIEFARLRQSSELEHEVMQAIDELLIEKRRTGESGTGPRIAALSNFIDFEIERLDQIKLTSVEPVDVAVFDTFFREWIG